MKKTIEIAFLCDQRACEERCSYPDCKHTTDIRHAKNFRLFGPSVKDNNKTVYFEDEGMADEDSELS